METVVQKWGNSFGIRIPSNLAKDLKLKTGEAVQITGGRDKIRNPADSEGESDC